MVQTSALLALASVSVLSAISDADDGKVTVHQPLLLEHPPGCIEVRIQKVRGNKLLSSWRTDKHQPRTYRIWVLDGEGAGRYRDFETVRDITSDGRWMITFDQAVDLNQRGEEVLAFDIPVSPGERVGEIRCAPDTPLLFNMRFKRPMTAGAQVLVWDMRSDTPFDKPLLERESSRYISASEKGKFIALLDRAGEIELWHVAQLGQPGASPTRFEFKTDKHGGYGSQYLFSRVHRPSWLLMQRENGIQLYDLNLDNPTERARFLDGLQGVKAAFPICGNEGMALFDGSKCYLVDLNAVPQLVGTIDFRTLHGRSSTIVEPTVSAINQNFVLLSNHYAYSGIFLLDDFEWEIFEAGLYAKSNGQYERIVEIEESVKSETFEEAMSWNLQLAPNGKWMIGVRRPYNLVRGDIWEGPYFWDLSSTPPKKSKTKSPISCAVFCNDNQWLVAADPAGKMSLWDLGRDDPRTPVRCWTAGARRVKKFLVSKDFLTALSDDYSVQVWPLQDIMDGR